MMSLFKSTQLEENWNQVKWPENTLDTTNIYMRRAKSLVAHENYVFMIENDYYLHCVEYCLIWKLFWNILFILKLSNYSLHKNKSESIVSAYLSCVKTPQIFWQWCRRYHHRHSASHCKWSLCPRHQTYRSHWLEY